jgi:hypothetical protein
VYSLLSSKKDLEVGCAYYNVVLVGVEVPFLNRIEATIGVGDQPKVEE